jgi:pSer/pThr/pTyr-binding forkhead associated (FHA) protein
VEAALNGPFGQTILGSGSVTIGRSSDNQIVLNDPQASSRHAEVRPEGEGYVISDLGSTNGTFINQQRLTPNVPYVLKPTDFIRIGSTEFTYLANDNQQDDATIAANPGEWNASSYAPTVGVAPAAYPPNYNPDAPAYPPPANYPQQGFQQPPANYPQQDFQQPTSYPQQGYPPSPPDYPNYGAPQQPYAPQVQPGQFNQPGQSGITAPGRPVQPPRKSRLGLWIALIIVLLVVIIAAGGAYLYVNRSTPTKTLQTYCDAIKTNNPQEAYNQLSTQAQSRTTLQRFTTTFNTAEQLLNSPLLGGIKTCAAGNVQENGTSATGTIMITVNNTSRSIPVNESLVNESGTWKISTVNRPSTR